MYQSILDLLIGFVGISTGVVGTTLEVVATIMCLFIVSIPFIVTYKVICWICGR